MYSIKKSLLLFMLATIWIGCVPGVQSGDISSKFAGVQKAVAISPTAVSINWTKIPDYSAYQIYTSDNQDPIAESVFSSSTIESLDPNTTYTFKVVAKDSNGSGGQSQISVKTWPRFTGVDQVFKNSDGALVVQWNYSYPVDHFEVFYHADSPPTAENTNNWATPNGTTRTNSMIFRNLNGSSTYYFTVHALYRGTEFERPSRAIAGSTNSSFPFPYFDLPKITIGSLPTLLIEPVITSQFPAENYETRVFKDEIEIADPVRGAGRTTFASTIPLPLGKIENISLKVSYRDTQINETLTIPGLSTYLKGTVPYLDLPPVTASTGPAFMGKASVTGDFNCDGFDDLAVGLPDISLAQYGVTKKDAGAVYVYYGGLNSSGKYILKTYPHPSLNPAVPGKDPQVLTFPDLSTSAQFGYSLAKGNLNGDKNGIYSCDDLAVGAPGQTNPDGLQSGNAFVFFGTANVGLKAPATISAFPQNSETCDGRLAGAACTGVRLWPDYRLWPMGAFGGTAFTASTKTNGGGTNIRYGAALAFVGDFNADGNEDLAIGAPNARWDGTSAFFIGNPAWDPTDVGYVALYFGSPFGLGYETPLADTSLKFRWLKIYPPIVQPGMLFGSSIAGGDVDGAYRVRDNNGNYIGGGDIVIGAPGFRYSNPDNSLFTLGSSGADNDMSITPADGGWWGNTSRSNSTNSRYQFSQSDSAPRVGTAIVYFGRSLITHSLVNNINNPQLNTFWECGRRGMTTSATHFSCLADSSAFRILFPRDNRTSGFGTSVAVIGDKSARDATDTLKCTPPSYPGPLTSVAAGPCRDANGDGFGDIIVGASTSNPAVGDSRTSTGALWQFFGNHDHIYEAGNTDNFSPAGTAYYLTVPSCQNFALSALAPNNSAFSAADRQACAPTKLIPNSTPSSAQMGKYASTTAVGDITRDGLMDVVVGATGDNTRGTNAGAAYVFTSLRGTGITTNFKKLVRNATDNDDLFGYAVAVGDFDAFGQSQEVTAYTCSSDGSDTCIPSAVNLNLLPFNDVAVGAPYANGNRPAGGGVHLFNSGSSVLPAIRTTSDVDLYDSIASMQDFRYGESRIVGDINGDGYDDAISHIQGFDSAGRQTFDAVVYFGSAYGLVTTSFCLANQNRVFKNSSLDSECYPSRTHAADITNSSIILPQLLVRPNNVSPGWAEVGYAAGDINGDGFADVALIDPNQSSNGSSLLLVYYGTRAGLQDVVVPSWQPATNDPQIVSRALTLSVNSNTNAPYTDMNYSRTNLVVNGDFNGDGYSDIAITSPQAVGPSLINPTTSRDPIDGHTETVQDVSGWPVNSMLNGTIWRCPANSTLVDECTGGRGPYEHGLVYIFYGSPSGVASPSLYSGGTIADLSTPGVAINMVYGTEDAFGAPTAAASSYCSSLSPSGGCIPVATVLRNPVFVNFKNGYEDMRHRFGAAITAMKINKTDTADTLVVSAPGYEHFNCLNYSDPLTSSPQLDQGRIYLFRGSQYGLLAANKTDYYPAPTDGNTAYCTNMPQSDDTGLGFDAFGRVRAMRMALAGTPTNTEQDAVLTAGDSRNSRSRSYGTRLTSAGDLNGDGFEDLLISAPYENVYDQNFSVVASAGAGYVIYGPLCPTDNDSIVQTYIQDPARLNVQTKFSDASVSIAASCAGKTLAPQKFRIKDIQPTQGNDTGSTSHRYGLSIAGGRIINSKQTGDVNLDGFADVVVGSAFWSDLVNSKTAVGRGVLFFGSPNGLYTDDYPSAVVETLSQQRTKPYILSSPESIDGANFFRANISAGDVNGDKSMDLMIPSENYDGSGLLPGIDLGAFFLFY